jgi:hypothetical protein
MKRNGGKKLSFLADTRVSASQAIKMFVISNGYKCIVGKKILTLASIIIYNAYFIFL